MFCEKSRDESRSAPASPSRRATAFICSLILLPFIFVVHLLHFAWPVCVAAKLKVIAETQSGKIKRRRATICASRSLQVAHDVVPLTICITSRRRQVSRARNHQQFKHHCPRRLTVINYSSTAKPSASFITRRDLNETQELFRARVFWFEANAKCSLVCVWRRDWTSAWRATQIVIRSSAFSVNLVLYVIFSSLCPSPQKGSLLVCDTRP